MDGHLPDCGSMCMGGVDSRCGSCNSKREGLGLLVVSGRDDRIERSPSGGDPCLVGELEAPALRLATRAAIWACIRLSEFGLLDVDDPVLAEPCLSSAAPAPACRPVSFLKSDLFEVSQLITTSRHINTYMFHHFFKHITHSLSGLSRIVSMML
jgi:hypothetical protein